MFLDLSVPVYLDHGTCTIMDAYARVCNGFCDYEEYDIGEFESGDMIEIRDIISRSIQVEHSTPGPMGS